MVETGWVAKANSLTKALYELVYRTGEIMLTSTMIGGFYVIRVVCANPSTEEKYIRLAFCVLVETAEKMLSREKQDTPNARL